MHLQTIRTIYFSVEQRSRSVPYQDEFGFLDAVKGFPALAEADASTKKAGVDAAPAPLAAAPAAANCGTLDEPKLLENSCPSSDPVSQGIKREKFFLSAGCVYKFRNVAGDYPKAERDTNYTCIYKFKVLLQRKGRPFQILQGRPILCN